MDDRFPPMNRRDALKATTALVGGSLLASSSLVTACAPVERAKEAYASALSPDDEQLIAEIADTLLPTTPSSPGAKAAGVGPAINLLLTDCYPLEAQQKANRGLVMFRQLVRDRRGGTFINLSPSEREALLRDVDAEAVRAGDAHWFHLVRELSLRAYFSSEIGMTMALRYVRVPGRWTGCVPLEPGQPAWG